MKSPIGTLFSALGSQMSIPDDQVPHYKEVPHHVAVEKARREWLAAKSYFDAVTDVGLVDYAIHLVEAAERKYMYLLRLARDGDAPAPATAVTTAAAPTKTAATAAAGSPKSAGV